jgi:hypothetical protein
MGVKSQPWSLPCGVLLAPAAGSYNAEANPQHAASRTRSHSSSLIGLIKKLLQRVEHVCSHVWVT